MQFDTLQSLPDRNSAEAMAMLQGATETLRESLAEARRLISGLRPPILDDMGVVAAIRHLLSDQPVDARPRVAFSGKVEFDRLEPVLENAIFRIVQEGMTNVRRHSKSDNVRLELAQNDDLVRIEIEDWGVGFDLENVPQDRFGLAGIRERARVLGGRATINSVPGKGTCITVELPLMESKAELPRQG
jgi:signal transduction histidine kinase